MGPILPARREKSEAARETVHCRPATFASASVGKFSRQVPPTFRVPWARSPRSRRAASPYDRAAASPSAKDPSRCWSLLADALAGSFVPISSPM